MGFLFVFLLISIFEPGRFFGGNEVWDILSLSSLVVGCMWYFPVRFSKFYYTPVVNGRGILLFSLFLLLLIISFVRTHSFLNTQFSVFKNAVTILLIPTFIYFYFQMANQKEGFSEEKLFFLIIHVLGIFCVVNIISFMLQPTFDTGAATLLAMFGINSKSVIFPMYPGWHPNTIGSLGGFLVVLSYGYYKYVNSLELKERCMLILYMISGTIIAIMGDSRGTFFAIIITIVGLTFIISSRQYRFLKYIVLILPFSHVLLILSLQFAAQTSYASQISRGHSSDLATGNSRKFIYMAANLELSKFKPVHIFGYGEYGIYGAGLTKYYMNKFGYETKESRLISSVAHNTALQAVFDVGYVGLVIFLFLLYEIFAQAQKMYKQGKEHYVLAFFFLTYHIITGISESNFGNYHSFHNLIFIIIAFFIINGVNTYLYKSKKVVLKT